MVDLYLSCSRTSAHLDAGALEIFEDAEAALKKTLLVCSRALWLLSDVLMFAFQLNRETLCRETKASAESYGCGF